MTVCYEVPGGLFDPDFVAGFDFIPLDVVEALELFHRGAVALGDFVEALACFNCVGFGGRSLFLLLVVVLFASGCLGLCRCVCNFVLGGSLCRAVGGIGGLLFSLGTAEGVGNLG